MATNLRGFNEVAMRPFQLDLERLRNSIEEMVNVTFADLQSQFLILPRGSGFIEFHEFQDAYEVLKKQTDAFSVVTQQTLLRALREDALVLVVIRTILGFSPPEWADLARSERGSDISQNAARLLDTKVRKERKLFAIDGTRRRTALHRVEDLLGVAADFLSRGAPQDTQDAVHRLNKVDTSTGLGSLRHVSSADVPYSMLLYERFLGRPFASHRDAVSELVGDVMESAIEQQLLRKRISFRKTRRAERIVGFDQAPDFFVPTEFAPRVVIEAKITGDDGTARDKVARILRLAEMRDKRERAGADGFELVACIDGRGFGVRKQDMRDVLFATRGKVFTLATLDRLVENTLLKEYQPRSGIA